jgi:hypothetical protein
MNALNTGRKWVYSFGLIRLIIVTSNGQNIAKFAGFGDQNHEIS